MYLCYISYCLQFQFYIFGWNADNCYCRCNLKIDVLAMRQAVCLEICFSSGIRYFEINIAQLHQFKISEEIWSTCLNYFFFNGICGHTAKKNYSVALLIDGAPIGGHTLHMISWGMQWLFGMCINLSCVHMDWVSNARVTHICSGIKCMFFINALDQARCWFHCFSHSFRLHEDLKFSAEILCCRKVLDKDRATHCRLKHEAVNGRCL